MRIHRILIVDDHALIRDGIKNLIRTNPDYLVSAEAEDGVQAIRIYKEIQPDIVIMDLSMPFKGGMEASKEILTLDANAKILILSMYEDEDYISQCMKIGVKGFVVKNESGVELLKAIGTILEGKNYFSTRVQQVIVNQYANQNIRSNRLDDDVKLTNREIEIVKLIAEGLTSGEVANKLFISQRTVETHRANLMKKLGVKNAIELVKRVEKLHLI